MIPIPAKPVRRNAAKPTRNLTGWKSQADTAPAKKRGRVDGIFIKKQK